MMVVSRALCIGLAWSLPNGHIYTYARNREEDRDNMMINVCSFVRDASGSAAGGPSFATGAAASSTLVFEPMSVSFVDSDKEFP
jgi:hypothetical protein